METGIGEFECIMHVWWVMITATRIRCRKEKKDIVALVNSIVLCSFASVVVFLALPLPLPLPLPLSFWRQGDTVRSRCAEKEDLWMWSQILLGDPGGLV